MRGSTGGEAEAEAEGATFDGDGGAQVSHILPVGHDAVSDRVGRLQHVARLRALVANHYVLFARATELPHGRSLHAHADPARVRLPARTLSCTFWIFSSERRMGRPTIEG